MTDEYGLRHFQKQAILHICIPRLADKPVARKTKSIGISARKSMTKFVLQRRKEKDDEISMAFGQL